jgi:putative DNA primase/helicase
MMVAAEQFDTDEQDIEPQSSGKYKPTDDEIGNMLIEDWDGKIRFFFGAWHEYESGVWKRHSRFAKPVWEKLIALKYSGIRPSAGKVENVLKYLETYLAVEDELIDNRREYINLQNGLFNIETGKLEPHSPDAFMTSQLPFPYDADADCPVFQRFLMDALVKPDSTEPDIDLQYLLLEAMGYSLTANTDFRVSFWLVGPSGTGKSVLINILQELAGTSHASVDLDELTNNPYQLADVAGKRLVTFTEPKANGVLADNHYKRLVSQDTIMARQIFGKPFGFVPFCKVWGAMNELPRVVDRSDAIFNRVIIIPMNRVMPESKKDLHLTEKLRGELAGIFNYALIGLKRLRRSKAFWKVEQSEQARKEYKAENDIEAAFVAECCNRNPDVQTNAQALYDAYNAWCKRNGAMAKSSVKVARDWERLGFRKVKLNVGNVWKGVQLMSIDGNNA